MWKPSLGGSVRHDSGVTRWKPCLLAPPGVQSCFLWGKCGQNCTGVQIIELLGTQMKGFWPHLLSDYCYYNFLIDQYSPTDENDLQESQRGTLALEERPRDWGAESPLVVEERTAVEQRAVTWLACWASSLIGVHVLILKYVCHKELNLAAQVWSTLANITLREWGQVAQKYLCSLLPSAPLLMVKEHLCWSQYQCDHREASHYGKRPLEHPLLYLKATSTSVAVSLQQQLERHRKSQGLPFIAAACGANRSKVITRQRPLLS